MATTSNFGWATPDDTDYVKDGASAMRTLGSAIDASLADLKGGADTYILAKNSAADMDFEWIPNALPSTPAGVNAIINGAFDIWQRGTTINLSSNSRVYGPDRFMAQSNFSAGTSTMTRQGFTAGTAPIAGYESAYFVRLTAGSTASYFDLGQKIEDVRTFAGQTVTLSFWAQASVATTVQALLQQNFGSGGSASVELSTNVYVTTSWQRFTFTTTLASLAGKTIGTGSHLGFYLVVNAPTNSQTFDLWGVQLEAGSVATPFARNGANMQAELAACQRYYVRYGGDAAYQNFGFGAFNSTTGARIQVPLQTTMRIAPTSVEWSGLIVTDIGASNFTPSSVTIDQTSRNLVNLSAAVTGATQFRPATLIANNSLSSYIGFSAEL